MTRFDIDDIVGRKQAGQCLRKHGYYERKYAADIAQATQKDTGHKCKVYKCPYCNLWHVTSKKHENDGFNPRRTEHDRT